MNNFLFGITFQVSEVYSKFQKLAEREVALRTDYWAKIREEIKNLPATAKEWQKEKIREELKEELGLPKLQKELESMGVLAVQQTKELGRKLIARARAGEFGAGKLYLVQTRNYKYYFSRLVGIQEDAESWAKYDGYGGLTVEEKRIYREANIEGIRLSDLKFEVDFPRFLEVTRNVSVQEVETHLESLLGEGFSFRTLAHVTRPEGSTIPVKPGQKFLMGSCNHHSGCIEAQGIFLPTGRVAVVTEYYGEHGKGRRRVFHGVICDPLWDPELSAKWGGELSNTGELSHPNQEEMDFLLGRESDMEVAEDIKELPPPLE